jgi:hypothetical protein
MAARARSVAVMTSSPLSRRSSVRRAAAYAGGRPRTHARTHAPLVHLGCGQIVIRSPAAARAVPRRPLTALAEPSNVSWLPPMAAAAGSPAALAWLLAARAWSTAAAAVATFCWIVAAERASTSVARSSPHSSPSEPSLRAF